MPTKRQALNADLTPEQIAERAYHIYLERGCVDGHDLEDWLQAESELAAEHSPTLHVVSDSSPPRRRQPRKVETGN